MSVPSRLDNQAQRLLALLVNRLPNARAANPQTFLGYKDVHDKLGLPKLREKWGDSLKDQGLVSLAQWTYETGKPAITGLVIDRTSLMPGPGYFDLFKKERDDFKWWKEEIDKSKQFDWSPFISAPPPPETPLAVDINIEGPAAREEVTTYRVIRDTLLARRAKQLHNYECQLCGHTIELQDGRRYAEAHHIQPLGAPHNGPDVFENIVCVCPNHHAELDYGARPLEHANLRSMEGHSINACYIEYHNTHIHRKS
ncbi:HNH endonuclease [Pseudomonas sp. S3E17]|jgi:hypothetical protein|uniref:HNH endonuclease n=1 Tax=Pseudomonas sp. S3E17 TaxID=2817893 RepID=UPI0020A06C70|nr:HNH endonuclease [Pseudomonas sp. S3E17]MCP1462544.1 hypothetical protein [Pseudomonas sp. S3E17]